MAGVMTSPADFVSHPAEVMPTLNNNRSAFGSIRHFLFRARHLSSRTRKGCMRNKQRLLPHTVFLPRGFCRTRQIYRLVRSISRRNVMFTKIASQKKHRTREKTYGCFKFLDVSSKNWHYNHFSSEKKRTGQVSYLPEKNKTYVPGQLIDTKRHRMR